MSNWTVAAKLRAAFLSMAAVFLAVGVFAIDRIETVNKISTEMRADWTPSIVAIGAINAAVSDFRIAEALHIVSTDAAEMDRREQEMVRLTEEIAQWRAKYERMVLSDEEKRIYQEFARDLEVYLDSGRRAVALSDRADDKSAAEILRTTGDLFDRISERLKRLVTLNQRSSAEAGDRADTIYDASRKLLAGAIGAVFVLAIAIMLFFERHISRPVSEVSGLIERLSRGDLDIAIPELERGDEIGRVVRATAAITVTLKDVAADLNGLVEAARAGALSSRAEHDRHPGEFGTLLAGINELIETLTQPLFEVANVMQKLAAGDLHGRMAGAYEGDLRALKANVNRSLDTLINLLSELGATANQLAENNLTCALSGSYQGEFAAIKGNMNRAIVQLRDTLKEIVGNSAQVAAASTETAAAARQVAEQSEGQLATLTDISGAIAQTAAAVGDISANAEQGSALARGAAGLAEDGRSQLARLMEAVERIAASNGRIGEITNRIERIADKTHVLSLNAGIEAARAGEQGLGFGIVAQQIGKLAEEAAAAVRDIASIIAEASQSATGGVAAAGVTRTAIERIAEAARDSERTVQNIASAIAQQAAVVQQLSEQVSRLHASGESNAAAAEEINATMENLAHMVEQVNGQIRGFVLA